MERTVIQPADVAEPAAPYSTAIRVREAGSLLFLAGAVSNDRDGRIVHPNDILAQTKQIVRNIEATLEAAGVASVDVVKMTTYVLSGAMKDYFETGAFLECLNAFNHPADTLVGVASLVGSDQGQLIEVDAIAVSE